MTIISNHMDNKDIVHGYLFCITLIHYPVLSLILSVLVFISFLLFSLDDYQLQTCPMTTGQHHCRANKLTSNTETYIR